MEKLAGVAGGSILEVKEALYQLLKSRPTPFKPDVEERLPYHAFKLMYDQGKLMLFVDRGLASRGGRNWHRQELCATLCGGLFNHSLARTTNLVLP